MTNTCPHSSSDILHIAVSAWVRQDFGFQIRSDAIRAPAGWIKAMHYNKHGAAMCPLHCLPAQQTLRSCWGCIIASAHQACIK